MMANTSNDDKKDYIREVQLYLRTISKHGGIIPTVSIDGIYGGETSNAVSEFQSAEKLPVTGDVDKATYDKISEVYERAYHMNADALPINVFENSTLLRLGDTGYDVYFLQVMLKALGEKFANIHSVNVTGKYDYVTNEAVNGVKRSIGDDRPENGVDKATYNDVTRLYNSL